MHTLTRWLSRAGLFGLLLTFCGPVWAQFTTASQDGTVSAASEYNNNLYVSQNGASAGGSWYISWDNTNLYLAKTGGNSAEPGFVYVDTNPVQPVTDAASLLGGNAVGSLTGTTDFGVTPQLPFRADARIYFQNNYAEIRYRNGSGGWGSAMTSPINISVSGSTREIVVSWNALTGNNGRPAQFNWLAYQTSTDSNTSNYRYDQAPSNPSSFADGNAAPPFEYYFTVLSTINGYYPTSLGDRPTSVISYTSQRAISYSSFGSLGVWDFTYDAPGQSLTRSSSSTGTNWTVGGTLTVSAGTLTFGDASGSGTTTAGNLLVTSTGVLNMNSTSNPLNVTGAIASTGNNVQLTNGGTLTLSSTFGGDLNLRGNFTLSSATTAFNPSNRAVGFVGNGTQLVTGPATGTPLTFDYVTVNGSSAANSLVRLASNVRINQTLAFTQGNLSTLNGANAYTLDLAGSGSLSGETDAKNLTGFVSSTKNVGAGGTGAVAFGNIGLTLTPNSGSAVLGSTTVTRSRGVGNLTGAGGNQSLNRNFRIVPTNTAGPFDVNLRFDYLDSEITAPNTENNLLLFSSTNATTAPASGSGTFAPQQLTSLDQTNNFATRNNVAYFDSGIVYTLGDRSRPLPVTLVSFGGRRVTGAVRLTWQTATEIDNAGFGIERQASNGEWQTVTFVPGSGNGQGHTYEYLDAQAPISQLYYRLRQTDSNGQTAYSPVVAVAATAPIAAALQLRPVPAPTDQSQLTVDLSTLPAALYLLTVYDLQGRLLMQATVPADATTTKLSVGLLAAGTYIVQARNSTNVFRTRFCKL